MKNSVGMVKKSKKKSSQNLFVIFLVRFIQQMIKYIPVFYANMDFPRLTTFIIFKSTQNREHFK